jgi:hypothetical protein
MADINQVLTRDEPLHFVYGAAFAQLPVAMVRALPIEYRIAVGLGAGFVAGVFKEGYDVLVRKTEFSLTDLAATTLGGIYSGVLG